MYEGPFGLVEDGEMEPRWTNPLIEGCRRVEAHEIGDLPNTVTPVRMQRSLHKIHSTPSEVPVTDEEIIDLSEEERAAEKTLNRLLIKPRLNRIRDRSKSDDIQPENIVNVSDKEVQSVIARIEKKAKKYRTHFLSDLLPNILGYDIAAGEAEAIARDTLETEMAIDDEMVDYIERIGVCAVLTQTMKDKKKIFSQDFISQVMSQWLTSSFDDVRETRKAKEKSNGKRGQFRRLMQEYEGLIARKDNAAHSPVGYSRARPQRPQQAVPEFFFDK